MTSNSYERSDDEEDFVVPELIPRGSGMPQNLSVLRKRRIIDDEESSSDDESHLMIKHKEEITSSTHKQEFVLPDCHDSSSSESSSDIEPSFHNRRDIPDTIREQKRQPFPTVDSATECHSYQPKCDKYNSDEALDAAFFAPESENLLLDRSRTRLYQGSPHQGNKENCSPRDSCEVVDLCGDSDGSNDDTQPVVHHQGLRVPKRSPRFNMVERGEALLSHARNTDRSNQLDILTRSSCSSSPVIYAPQTNNDDDDIVECWSSDEDRYVPRTSSRQRARRVTDTFARPAEDSPRVSVNTTADFGDTSYQTEPNCANHNPLDEQSHQIDSNHASYHQQAVAIPGRWSSERSDRRRKLRDATNLSFARAVVPKNNNDFLQTAEPIENKRNKRNHNSSRNNSQRSSNSNAPFTQTKNNDVWYRNAQPYDTAHAVVSRNLAAQRNDVHGGSGAGVTGYDFQSGGSNYYSEEEEGARNNQVPPRAVPRPSAWTTSNNITANKSTNTKRKKMAGKSKSWSGGGGRGKKSWGRKGRGANSKSKATGCTSRSTRKSGGDQPYMEIARQDPHLKHVGGAKMEF